MESHDNEQFAHVGAGVHLSCNVSGRDLRTRWTKDGRPLPRTVRQKQDGSLFIGRAQKSDSGHYVCVIQDPYGRQTVNYINLHIEGQSRSHTYIVNFLAKCSLAFLFQNYHFIRFRLDHSCRRCLKW